MRLVINDILTESDKNAIIAANDGRPLPVFDLGNIEDTISTLSARDKHFFECLSWLIRNERIEIKIVAPLSGEGVAHTKCGVFCDGVSKVAFDGSVNFSLTALLQNKEGLTAFCSWDNALEREKISDIEEEFLKTFKGEDETVRYLNPQDVKTRVSSSFEEKDIVQLLQDEYEILDSDVSYAGKTVPSSVLKSMERAKERVRAAIACIQKETENSDVLSNDDIDSSLPVFPFPAGPKNYQSKALQNWKENGQKGMFNMATGTGKTITSLNCLLEIYRQLGYYKAVILVPTITLVEQWADECRRFHFNNIVNVCSRNSAWPKQIGSIILAEGIERKEQRINYVIICTYASFAKENVFSTLCELSHPRVLLIADEAHNMGSGTIRKRLEQIPFKRRIGLSATPDRQFDEEGTELLRAFFGAKGKYTFEYTMDQAIGKALCVYEYYPHLVRLTDIEMEEYKKISDKLAKMFNSKTGRLPETDEYVKMLLLQRKAIIHKAENKLSVFKDIILQRLKEKGDLKYTLVYAPEGTIPDSWDADCFSDKDYMSDDVDTDNLIEAYTAIIRDASPTITVRKFTSDTSERDDMLRDFATGDLQVLTSMKCLDEGVDVPRSEMAIFCASTGNPRQFIQRRGRILRRHPDKKYAVIHDLVVIPDIIDGEDNYRMERSLLAGEIKRVRNFALLSRNASYAISVLDEVLDYYNISIFD